MMRGRAGWRICIMAGISLAALAAGSAGAQVVTDGSAGAAQTLTGPNYAIPQSLGTTNSAGTTLVQSFTQFDVGTGETATFSGSGTLTAILARVTGGASSSIAGTLAVDGTAPNAALYLINPSGIVFGAGTVIDVAAGFHVATANQVNFADGSVLPITATPVGALTMDTVASFGFLGGNTSGIDIGSIDAQSSTPGRVGGTLYVTTNGSVSIGSDGVHVNSSGANGGAFVVTKSASITLNGPIDAYSTAAGGSGGSVNLTTAGALTFSNGAKVNAESRATTSNGNGGIITANVGSLVMGLDTYIGAYTNSVSGNGGTISFTANGTGSSLAGTSTQAAEFNVNTNNGQAGTILLATPGTLSLDFADFEADGNQNGTAGSIVVQSGSMPLANALLRVRGFNGGNAGTATVRTLAGDIANANLGYELYSTGGNGGTATLSVAGQLTTPATVTVNASTTNGTGGSAVVTIGGGGLNLASTQFNVQSANADSGNITLSAAGPVAVPTNYFLDAHSAAGKGGNVAITAGSLTVASGAGIRTDAAAAGKAAGNVTLTTTSGGTTFTSASINAASTSGASGKITASLTGGLSLDTSTFDTSSTSGTAGNIDINAASLSLVNNSAIHAAGGTAGNAGGNITVHTTGNIAISQTGTNESLGTFSATGNGGNITLTSDSGAVTLQRALIDASGGYNGNGVAAIGHAGDVTINAASYSQSGGIVYFDTVTENWDAGHFKLSTSGAATFTPNGTQRAGLYGDALGGHGGSITMGIGGALSITSGYFDLNNGPDITQPSIAPAGTIAISADTLNMLSSIMLTWSDLTAGSTTIHTTGNATISGGGAYSIATITGTSAFYGATSNGRGGALTLDIGGELTLTNASIDMSSGLAYFPLAPVATAGGGSVTIKGTNGVSITGGDISTSSYIGQQGGTIGISSPGAVTLTGTVVEMDSVCSACAFGPSPNGGSFTASGSNITLGNVQLTAKGDEGNGGALALTAQNALSITGGELSVNSEAAVATGRSGGTVTLGANSVALTDAWIRGASWGTGGTGGALAVQAHDITLNAVNSNNFFAIDFGGEHGTGGQVLLQADSIAVGGGAGLPVTIRAGGLNATGDVVMRARTLTLGNGATVGFANSFDTNLDRVGNVSLYANTVTVNGGAEISSALAPADPAATAGAVTIGATDFVMNGGKIDTYGQDGGIIRIAGDTSITLNGGTVTSTVGGVSPSGNIYIGLTLAEPVFGSAACGAGCQAYHPFSTAWTPGTQSGIPVVYNRDAAAANLTAAGTSGQVIYGLSPVNAPDKTAIEAPVLPEPRTDAMVADASSAAGTQEVAGFPYFGRDTRSMASLCAVDNARRKGRDIFRENIDDPRTAIPGALRLESYAAAAVALVPDTCASVRQGADGGCGSHTRSRLMSLPSRRIHLLTSACIAGATLALQGGGAAAQTVPPPEALMSSGPVLPAPILADPQKPFDLPPLPQLRRSPDAYGTRGAVFRLHDIQVTAIGKSPLTQMETDAITGGYKDRDITLASLAGLRDQLTQAMVRKGYINSGAVFPAQDLANGVLHIVVVEGRLTRIDVHPPAGGYLSSDYVRRRLATADGQALNVYDLQRAYQLMLEDPNIDHLDAHLGPGDAPGEAVLDVTIREKPRNSLKAFVASDRSPSVGKHASDCRGSGPICLPPAIWPRRKSAGRRGSPTSRPSIRRP